MRSLIVMGTWLTVSLGLVMGAEFTGTIKKIDGNKLTILVGKKKDVEGVEKTYTVAKDAKISKGKFNPDTKKQEAGDALEGGLKNEAVKVDAKGSFVTDADDKNITSIIIGGGKGGKKKE